MSVRLWQQGKVPCVISLITIFYTTSRRPVIPSIMISNPAMVCSTISPDLRPVKNGWDYFPMRGILQSGQVWLRQETPRVFGYSFLQFGQMHASGGIPLLCIPIPGPPFGMRLPQTPNGTTIRKRSRKGQTGSGSLLPAPSIRIVHHSAMSGRVRSSVTDSKHLEKVRLGSYGIVGINCRKNTGMTRTIQIAWSPSQEMNTHSRPG